MSPTSDLVNDPVNSRVQHGVADFQKCLLDLLSAISYGQDHEVGARRGHNGNMLILGESAKPQVLYVPCCCLISHFLQCLHMVLSQIWYGLVQEKILVMVLVMVSVKLVKYCLNV